MQPWKINHQIFRSQQHMHTHTHTFFKDFYLVLAQQSVSLRNGNFPISILYLLSTFFIKRPRSWLTRLFSLGVVYKRRSHLGGGGKWKCDTMWQSLVGCPLELPLAMLLAFKSMLSHISSSRLVQLIQMIIFYCF